MKNITSHKMNKIKYLLVTFLFCIMSYVSIGQTAPAPPPPPCPTNPDNKVGGKGPAGSPVGEGVWLTLGLAFAYGAYEFWKAKKRAKDSKEA
jgi:hypothetical protein